MLHNYCLNGRLYWISFMDYWSNCSFETPCALYDEWGFFGKPCICTFFLFCNNSIFCILQPDLKMYIVHNQKAKRNNMTLNSCFILISFCAKTPHCLSTQFNIWRCCCNHTYPYKGPAPHHAVKLLYRPFECLVVLPVTGFLFLFWMDILFLHYHKQCRM